MAGRPLHVVYTDSLYNQTVTHLNLVPICRSYTDMFLRIIGTSILCFKSHE